MEKLLAQYEEKRDIKSAKKAVAYAKKHPMALCLLSSVRMIVLQSALDAVAIHSINHNIKE